MSKTTETTVKGFLNRVLNFLKDSDESNVSKNLDTIKKVWNGKIASAEKRIKAIASTLETELERQEEMLEDAKQFVEEAYLNVSSDKMSYDERISYVDKYETQIAIAIAKKENVDKEIERLKSEAEKQTEKCKTDIAKYKEFLAKIQ